MSDNLKNDMAALTVRMKKAVNAHDLKDDIAVLTALAKDRPEDASDVINDFCDTLNEDDVFGTEGQCDPRGDNRNEDAFVEDDTETLLEVIKKMEKLFENDYTHHNTLQGILSRLCPPV